LLGLGPGGADLLTRAAWDILTLQDNSGKEVFLRTRQHPVVAEIPRGITLHSFDDLYVSLPSFEKVYEEIVARILELGQRPQGVIYAVPGHPMVAEATGPEILRRARELDIPVQIVEGLSFLEPTFSALGLDPFPHTALVDALELAVAHTPMFPVDAPAIIAQIHSKAVASDVKLTLMEVYPDEHPVNLVHAAGTSEKIVENLFLHEIDRSPHIGLLTVLYLPPLARGTSLQSFQEVIAHLRAPDGCPWDREQTHQTLRPNLLEETFELLEALDRDDPQGMREEFGDLLLQIVLHAQIASEYGEFTMAEVIHGIHNKIISRHPHVFGEVKVESVGQVIENWERLKAAERESNGSASKNLLDGVAGSLPALAQTQQYQQRVTRIGMNLPNTSESVAQISRILLQIQSDADPNQRLGEIGELLFHVVNLARQSHLSAEDVLREENARFRQRFTEMEKMCRARGQVLSDLKTGELDALWQATKNP
jgi:tetrapyrrole methylase family protein/MazG family protein